VAALRAADQSLWNEPWNDKPAQPRDFSHSSQWFWNTEIGWARPAARPGQRRDRQIPHSLDRLGPVTAKEWDASRHRWRHTHGLTNMWRLAPLHGVQRVKGTMRRAAPRVYNPSSSSGAHLNQKPLEFMHRILNAVTDPGGVIWEPFGGLASAPVAAVQAGRNPCVAELDPGFAQLAARRLIDVHHTELG
jgi:DNA modification methylase